MAAGRDADAPGTLIVGHDCRQDAHAYAELAAQVAAGEGFNVLLTEDYCPTPTLCWSVAHNDDAVGGIMLTSSHNPAEYLGVKLRMADGGAPSSPIAWKPCCRRSRRTSSAPSKRPTS